MEASRAIASEQNVLYGYDNNFHNISELHTQNQTDGRRYVFTATGVNVGLYDEVIKNLLKSMKNNQLTQVHKKLIRSKIQQLTRESKSDGPNQVQKIPPIKLPQISKTMRAVTTRPLLESTATIENQIKALSFQELKHYLMSNKFAHIAIGEYERDIPNFMRSVSSIEELEKEGLPLHFAVLHRDALLVELLCSTGCKIDKSDKDNNNSLMLACQIRDPHLVALLITKGVSLTQRNHIGKSPLHLLMSQCPSLFEANILISLFGKQTKEIYNAQLEQIREGMLAWNSFVAEDEKIIENLSYQIADLNLKVEELAYSKMIEEVDLLKQTISNKSTALSECLENLALDKAQQKYNQEIFELFMQLDVPDDTPFRLNNPYKELNLWKKEVQEAQQVLQKLNGSTDREDLRICQYFTEHTEHLEILIGQREKELKR